MMHMKELTHTNAKGEARMVDVSDKSETSRVAEAEATVLMKPETLNRVMEGNIGKGDTLAVARVAGIQAAKKTSDLIPLCHPLALSKVTVSFRRDSPEILVIHTLCKVSGKTGVEMEALLAASTAALTIYDMCKAIERGIQITNLRLVRKSGGQSGDWSRS